MTGTVSVGTFAKLAASVPRRSNDLRAIAGKDKAIKVDQTEFRRMLKEYLMENLKQPGIGLVIRKRGLFKEWDEIFNMDIFHWRCFIIRILRFIDFAYFGWLGMGGKVILARHPETVTKVVESTDTGSVIRMKAAYDGGYRVGS